MTDFWNTAGRIDDFWFEKISCRDLTKSLGVFPAEITGGILTFDWTSKDKTNGQLEVVNAKHNLLTDENLVRVWYTPEVNGVKKNIRLGTYYYVADLHYENGQWKGTIDLVSTLSRFTQNTLTKVFTVNKGQTIATVFKNITKAIGDKGFTRISNVKNHKMSKTKTFDPGTSVMDVYLYIAKYSDSRINVDTLGKLVLENKPAIKTQARNIKHKLVADEASVILPGVDSNNSLKSIPNRVVCVYDETVKKEKKKYVGVATLAKKEKRSYSNIRKWITHYEHMSQCHGEKAADKRRYLKKKAKAILTSKNKNHTYYVFQSYYQPIEMGEVIGLQYDNIKVKGVVTNLDINLAIGATMDVKIRKVGSY